MAQETPDDFADEIDAAMDEIATRREREQERHEQKMAEIDERKDEMLDSFYEQAGLAEVEEAHEELDEIRERVLDKRDEIQDMVLGALNNYLSGGYDETITVRDGGVYKYNKRRNARLDFKNVVEGHYRTAIDNALDASNWTDAPRAIKNAMDMVEAKALDHMEGSWTASTGIDVTEEVETYSSTETREWVTLGLVYKQKRWVRSGSPEYVNFEEEDDDTFGRPNNKTMSPTSREPDHIKLMAQVKDDLLYNMETIRRKMERTERIFDETIRRLKEDLPTEEAETEINT